MRSLCAARRSSIDGAVAMVLCSSLCLPAPLGLAQQPAGAPQPAASTKSRTEYAGQLKGDERILQALNRFTFGPKPGDLEAVRQMGLEKWFDQQLHPAGIDETDLNARLAQYPAMQWSTQDLIFRLPSRAMIRQASDGKIQIPANGTLHAVYENQIYRYETKKAAKADKQTPAGAAPVTAPGSQNPGARPREMPANMNAAANSGMANSGTDNSGAMENAPAAESGENQAPPAMAPSQEMNSMEMAAGTNQDQPRVDEASFDEASIQRVLALEPEQRIARLQSMQPEEFESFIKSLRPAQRTALIAGMTPGLKEALGDLESPEQTMGLELLSERLTRDIYSNAQLQEVMTDFWLNHFNIYLRKNEQMPYYLVSYQRDVIRPQALGRFEDLLEAVAHSPAMLLYLDNAQSIGPDSPAAERAQMGAARRPNAKKQAPEGLNENYGRELMELHTLGVNGGYTQADVTQVARILTGWTVDRPQYGGQFIFATGRHEPGTKVVMGQKFKDNGEMEGRELLHMLATSPATAHFISRELAIRFVNDEPPQALVERMAKAYVASGGDIPTVLKTLFHSPEFWSVSDYRAKVKTPLEFVVSAVRASNAAIDNYQPLIGALRQMGMPLYGCVPPVGYKWDAADWVSTGALVDRMNFALALAAGRFPGITVEWAPELDMSALDNDAPAQQVVPTPESEEARLEQLLVAGGVSATTRAAALEEFQKQSAQNSASARPVVARRQNNRAPRADAYEREDQLLAGLLMGSPEFQRR